MTTSQQDAILCQVNENTVHTLCRKCLDAYRNEVLEEAASLVAKQDWIGNYEGGSEVLADMIRNLKTCVDGQ